MKHWLTFGMSAFQTVGFHDTSRQMTDAFDGQSGYIQPQKPFTSWKKLDGHPLATTVAQVRGVDVFTPPLPIPRKVDPFRVGLGAQVRAMERTIDGVWGRGWRDNTVVYVTNWTPQFQPFIERLSPKTLVFDVVDDVLSFPYAWDVDRVMAAWRQAAKMATAVTAVSPYLQEKVARELGTEAHCLPNGVDAELFGRPTTPAPLPGAERSVKVGFAGTLNHWIDFGALQGLAEQWPDVQYYLLGREGHFGNAEWKAEYDGLLRLPNVHYLGAVDYTALPGYLQQMDILIIPRRTGPSSQASSPLKLYEYLAVGKPIVVCGSPVPEDVVPYVYNAPDSALLPNVFADALKEAEMPSVPTVEARQAVAAHNTWQKRVERVLSLVRQR